MHRPPNPTTLIGIANTQKGRRKVSTCKKVPADTVKTPPNIASRIEYPLKTIGVGAMGDRRRSSASWNKKFPVKLPCRGSTIGCQTHSNTHLRNAAPVWMDSSARKKNNSSSPHGVPMRRPTKTLHSSPHEQPPPVTEQDQRTRRGKKKIRGATNIRDSETTTPRCSGEEATHTMAKKKMTQGDLGSSSQQEWVKGWSDCSRVRFLPRV